MDRGLEVKKLYIGFKGKNNMSCALVKSISPDSYLLTNSFSGVKRDIELLNDFYDFVFLFGIDKNLKNSIRIEQISQKEEKITSVMDLEQISSQLTSAGITNHISNKPTHYLCNEAYWYLLHKFKGRSILFHIPSKKNSDETFVEKLKEVFISL